MERGDAPKALLPLAVQQQDLPGVHAAFRGCRVCPVCGKRTGEPCRHPQQAISSLEAYGVNVSLLAQAAGMRYTNGQNTVTYFGAVFCRKAQ